MDFDAQWLKTCIFMQECALGVHTMAENIFCVQISQPSKMAFYRHVQASMNGFKMNDVVED